MSRNNARKSTSALDVARILAYAADHPTACMSDCTVVVWACILVFDVHVHARTSLRHKIIALRRLE